MAVVDQQLFQSLTWMSENDITDVIDHLDFTAQHESFGTLETTELVSGGADIPVTEANKHEYIQLLCQHRLRGRVEQQLEAFKTGLGEIVPLEELQVFDEKEFEVRRSFQGCARWARGLPACLTLSAGLRVVTRWHCMPPPLC